MSEVPLYRPVNFAAVTGSGRGTTRADDAQGAPTQSHISPSILVYEEEQMKIKSMRRRRARAHRFREPKKTERGLDNLGNRAQVKISVYTTDLTQMCI